MDGISRLYGKALYDLANERGNLEACLDQAALVRDAVGKPESRRVLEHPHIPKAEKVLFLRNAFSGGLVDPLASFLELLIDRNRAGILASSLSAFLRLGDQWRGIVEAHVVSAVDLREEQVSALRNVLARKLGKRVDMTLAVDPALIGGFYLNVDGHCIDSRVRRRLLDMRHSIEKGEGFYDPQTR